MKKTAYIHFFCKCINGTKTEYKCVLGCTDPNEPDYMYLDNKNFFADGYSDFVKQYKTWFVEKLKFNEDETRFIDLQIC